jgi:hypothetical protein
MYARYRAIASLYRQTAAFRPLQRHSLLGEAERWEHLAISELEVYFSTPSSPRVHGQSARGWGLLPSRRVAPRFLVATNFIVVAMHGFGNRFGIIEVILLILALYRGGHIWPASTRHRAQAMRVCGSSDVRRRRLPCRSGKAVYWRAALPLRHATTFAVARWRCAHPGPRRGTSSCRYRCRSRRWQFWVGARSRKCFLTTQGKLPTIP